MQLVDSILTQTAEVFQRTPTELVGRSRKQPIVLARQAAMWAIRQRYPSLPLEMIGHALGGRHYSTVMHGLAAVELRAQDNQAYREQLQLLITRINASGQIQRTSLACQPCIRGITEHSIPSKRSTECPCHTHTRA